MRPSLKKLPTLWLDERDSIETAHDVVGDPWEISGNLDHFKFEVIMGTASGQSSPGGSNIEENCSLENCSLHIHDTERRCDHDWGTKEYRKSALEHQRKTQRALHSLDGMIPSKTPISVTDADFGRTRGIASLGLLVIRLVVLSVLGVLAGLSLSLHDRIPSQNLLCELFIWLHATHFVLILLLVVASLPTANAFPDDYRGREFNQSNVQPFPDERIWKFVNALSHTARVLSQAEIVRLILLHFFPSLQPFRPRDGSNKVFLLGSVFSFQRYAMATFSFTEFIFSTAPESLFHSAFVLMFSCCWEIYMYRWRATDRAFGTRVGLSFMGIAMAVSLSVLHVAIERYLSTHFLAAFRPDNTVQRTTETV